MNYFDLHCDTPFECYTKKQEFGKNCLAVSGSSGKSFESWKQTFAVWINDSAENPFLLYRNILDSFKAKLTEKPQNLTPLFSVEGGTVLEEDSDRLYILKQDGIKLLTLTWNGKNSIAGGSKTDADLTDFGKTVINKMNRLKMGCDLSHLNEKSFYSAIEIAEYPLATHSNCKSICPHQRNLTDAQLRLIGEKGGVVGICFYPEFLGGEVFGKIYENICRLLELRLESCIAIGSDFDGGKMDKKLCNVSQIPDLYRFLESKGLKKDLLDKIFYKNADNYIAKLS